MLDVLIDALKAGAPLLAVLLPGIAAYFAYRNVERKPPTVGQAAMLSIGGALADRDATERTVEAVHALNAAVDALTHAIVSSLAENRRTGQQYDELIDEAKEMRRALEEMVVIKKRSGVRNTRQDT